VTTSTRAASVAARRERGCGARDTHRHGGGRFGRSGRQRSRTRSPARTRRTCGRASSSGSSVRSRSSTAARRTSRRRSTRCSREATTAEGGGWRRPGSEPGRRAHAAARGDRRARQQLLVDARIFGSGIEFVEEAEAPTSPIAPTPRRTAAATAVLGALLAAAFAYWRAGHGRKIASRDEPGEVLGAPLLGVLPTYKPAQHVTLAQRTTLEPRMAEAYRFVYSSLGAILREHGARSVMVTSASPAIGKTETALQLAATAARRGQSVLLIDADLRMRGLTSLPARRSSSGAPRPRRAAGRAPRRLVHPALPAGPAALPRRADHGSPDRR
jgi:hypothetical protein